MTLAIFILVTCVSILAYMEHRHEQKEAAIIEAYRKLDRQHERDLQLQRFSEAELKAARQSIEEYKKQISQLKSKLSSSETMQAELEKQLPRYTQQEAELHEAIHQHIQKELLSSLNEYANKYNTSHIPYNMPNEITAQIVKAYVLDHNIKATITDI